MGRTFLRQITQIRTSDTFDDTIVPSLANFETNPTEIETDLNTLRSRTNDFLNRNDSVFTGNWYDSISAPSTFEGGIARGINLLNQDLHDLQRKRVLDRVSIIGNDISVASANDQFVILALSELPGNTTIAVGAVTTLGTVAAFEASFGTATLTEVTGPNALRPKNLAVIWNASGDNIGDVVDDADGTQIFGLIQSESASDGFTATGTTPVRLQMSFVKTNAAGDDLELVTAGEMSGVVFDYAPIERFAFGDLPEDAFLGTDFVDSGVANTTRDAAYVSQGTTPVDLLTNATLDLEGPGLTWEIRDDLEATLLKITEGSAGGTSTILFGAAVDTFDNDAASNNFLAGVSLATGSGNTINIGLSSGLISSSTDLSLRATSGEIRFDDGNRSGSTWGTSVKLTNTTAEWDDYETAFGEASLFSAIVQANGPGTTTREDVYGNQGATAANVTTSSFLKLDTAGIVWEIRDDLSNGVFKITEGSAGGTTFIQFTGNVDQFLNSSLSNVFENPLTVNSTGTNPIRIAADAEGLINTSVGDMQLQAAAELSFDDGNQTGSTWAADAVKLTETTAEWDLYETNFGEVSLFNAMNQNAASAAGVTRQDVYDNQGVTPVNVLTNSFFDLNSAGVAWEIRDLANNNLFRITEGSTGGTTQLLFGSDVDNFVSNAIGNTFTNGVTINGILVSKVAGVISRAGDLTFDATSGEILFDDTYRGSSSYSQNLRLADSIAEWTAFDTAFGEVSILNAIVAANTNALPMALTTSSATP